LNDASLEGEGNDLSMSSAENGEANDTLAASLAGSDTTNLYTVIDRDK